MLLKDFSEIVNGAVIGDPATELTGVSGIQEAGGGDITFISSPAFLRYVGTTKASCIITKTALENCRTAQLIVSNPYYVFAKALELFYPAPQVTAGISPGAFVSETAAIGLNVSVQSFAYVSDGASLGDGSVIFPGVFIGRDTKIGGNCIIHPNVTIRENVQIGDRVIVHSGTVIGSDGFGYVLEKGAHYKIPQVGGVIIGSDVEIGSNVTIDRATTGNTIIGNGAKIDNLVQIAHNVAIGDNSIIVAQTGIAGSSSIGDYVVLGGQVGIADHTTIASGTMVASQAGVKGEISKGVYSGSPAIPHATWLRAQSLFARLPELNKRIRDLEEKIAKLEKGEKPC